MAQREFSMDYIFPILLGIGLAVLIYNRGRKAGAISGYKIAMVVSDEAMRKFLDSLELADKMDIKNKIRDYNSGQLRKYAEMLPQKAVEKQK